MNNFWEKLKKPFFVMAPMADVTDAVFRQIITKYSEHGTPHGGPDVFFTEFVSSDGLMSAGREALMRDLDFSDNELPIVAQLFTSNPETMRGSAKLAKELGFDGIDINMGCPDRNVEKQGAGASMMKNPKLAQEVIRAAQEGAEGLPVSVKTRVGYSKDELDTWLPALLETKPAAVTIHARTRSEMSNVPAVWSRVAHAVEIAKGSDTLIIGNGDVESIAQGRKLALETGADGIMLGRAIFGNPWLFNKKVVREDIPLAERLRVMVEHTKLFEETFKGAKNFAIMKKHYKAYVTGFDGAKELRMELMEGKTAQDIERTIEQYLKEGTHKSLDK